jgi:hypothetical protein
MFLEFHLVFTYFFQIFFFKISEFQFKKSAIFKIGPGRFGRILAIFRKIGQFFKPYSPRPNLLLVSGFHARQVNPVSVLVFLSQSSFSLLPRPVSCATDVKALFSDFGLAP